MADGQMDTKTFQNGKRELPKMIVSVPVTCYPDEQVNTSGAKIEKISRINAFLHAYGIDFQSISLYRTMS